MATGNFSFLQMELTYNETKVGTCPALLGCNIHCTMYLHYTTDIFSGARIECTLYLPLGLQIDYGFTIRSLYRYDVEKYTSKKKLGLNLMNFIKDLNGWFKFEPMVESSNSFNSIHDFFISTFSVFIIMKLSVLSLHKRGVSSSQCNNEWNEMKWK